MSESEPIGLKDLRDYYHGIVDEQRRQEIEQELRRPDSYLHSLMSKFSEGVQMSLVSNFQNFISDESLLAELEDTVDPSKQPPVSSASVLHLFRLLSKEMDKEQITVWFRTTLSLTGKTPLEMVQQGHISQLIDVVCRYTDGIYN